MSGAKETTMVSEERRRELAAQLRVDSIRATTRAGSGHPTSALSAADLMAVLLDGHLRYDFSNPKDPDNDHLIFSKGHACPLLYAMFKAAGAMTDEQLMSLRTFGSPLEGHPAPVLPWIEVATGSLGQGLAIGVGLALAGKYLDRRPYRVWVLSGDSEMAEGSVWEAVEHAAFYRLSNLICIVDVNRLGQRGPTMLGWNTAAYAARAQAFGWRTIEIDGHDLGEIDDAYTRAAASTDAPVMILARTVKGKGVAAVEDRDGWHGKALPAAEAEKAIAALGGVRSITVEVRRPAPAASGPMPAAAGPLTLPSYHVGDAVATRRAYGDALRALGAARPEVVVLDGEVNNSTYAEEFARAYPDRYFEMYIAEQQMVAAAVGLQVRGYIPFASTFAAFLTRAYDFIRMAAVSRANLRLCGSHAGVSIGADGPSQMGLEDLAMMRAVGGSTVLYPCDANQTARLVAAMVDRPGIVYLRTTREKTPVIYGPDQTFPIGGSVVVRRSPRDQATIVAAGITVHEALKAAERLTAEGVAVRVIDAYSVKPIDRDTLREAARETGRVVVVEDHWPEGGLGEAVLSALAGTTPFPHVVTLGVRGMPGSGTPEELLDAAGISAGQIVRVVRALAPVGGPVRG
ncbi:MAG: transketolase [Armatimonadota bacterium]|nr:transketolase [Armatimonadota bacterium]MDR7451388.1 transketolase [Armatimonadota bacterium]MDR7466462.1 transketolase [Armatimonadota bacterium]MDR7493184.1 transketolase [Armatimonadota bacterium]MDR7499463.1 transketolase [Armatimonadota bacterium]